MKRYLLFMGYDYEAGGGWHDLHGSGDDLDALVAIAKSRPGNKDWWHIVDITVNAIIKES